MTTFRERMRRLEALEAEVEAAKPCERTAADADAVTDDEAVAIGCWGIQVDMLRASAAGFRPVTYWEKPFWKRVGERLTELAAGRVVVALSLEQIDAARQCMAAGAWTVYDVAPPAWWHMIAPWEYIDIRSTGPADSDAKLRSAVKHAWKAVLCQEGRSVGHPRPTTDDLVKWIETLAEEAATMIATEEDHDDELC